MLLSKFKPTAPPTATVTNFTVGNTTVRNATFKRRTNMSSTDTQIPTTTTSYINDAEPMIMDASDGNKLEKAHLLDALYELNAARIQLVKDSFNSVSEFYNLTNRLKLERRIVIELVALAHKLTISTEILRELLANNAIVKVGDQYVYNGPPAQYREAICRVLCCAIRNWYHMLSDQNFVEHLKAYVSYHTITAFGEFMHLDPTSLANTSNTSG